ncbi:MAG: hypothetical protein WCJ58_00480 [bacterium]
MKKLSITLFVFCFTIFFLSGCGLKSTNTSKTNANTSGEAVETAKTLMSITDDQNLFPIKDFYIQVADNWKFSKDLQKPATFKIQNSKNQFTILISIIPYEATDEGLKSSINKSKESLLSDAVEKDLTINSFSGSKITGYYTSQSTDKNYVGKKLPEGQWLNAMQGCFTTSSYSGTFTFLYNTSDTTQINEALKMIESIGIIN